MKWIVIGALAALAVTPALAEPITVAGGNWSDIPPIRERHALRIGNEAIEQLKAAAGQTNCRTVGDARHLNISVPFLVQFSPHGDVEQVVVQRINCPKVEALLGYSLLYLAKSGEYRPTGENDLGWYRGQFDLISD